MLELILGKIFATEKPSGIVDKQVRVQLIGALHYFSEKGSCNKIETVGSIHQYIDSKVYRG